MSWSFSGHRGSASNKVSGTLLAISPNQTVPVGAILVAVCVSDNIATGGGQTKNHALADPQGNPWVKLREQSNADVAAAGITLSVWCCQLTTQLATTDVLALALTAATTAKAIGLYEYAVSSGHSATFIAQAGSEQDATTAPSVTLSGLPSGQTLALFGVAARENDTAGTYTQDADYNDRTKFGTTGSTGNTNVSCIVGDRIVAVTSDTFGPTALSASADCAAILVAMLEVDIAQQAVIVSKPDADTVQIAIGPEVLTLPFAQVVAFYRGYRTVDVLLTQFLVQLKRAGVNPATASDASIKAAIEAGTYWWSN